MKNTVRAIIRFSFFILIFSPLLATIEYLTRTAESGSWRFPFSFELLIASLRDRFPLVIAIALFAAFLALRFRPGRRLLTYGVLFAAALAFLGFGTWGLGMLSAGRNSMISETAMLGDTPQKAGLVRGTPEGTIYLESAEGTRARGLVIARYSDSSAGLEFHPSAEYRVGSSSFFEDGSGKKIVSLPKTELSGKFLSAPTFVVGLGNDAADISLKMDELAGKGIFFRFALAGAIALLLLACWPLSRLSAWPLVDALLCAFALRFALFLCAILSSDTIGYIVRSAIPSFPGDWIAPILIGFIGAAIIAIDLLIIPYSASARTDSRFSEEG